MLRDERWPLRNWLGRKRPKWAAELSDDDYRSFRSMLDAKLRERGHVPDWDAWENGVTVALQDGLESRMALGRIAGAFAAAPQEERGARLDDFLSSSASLGPADALPASWDEARERLLAKVYPLRVTSEFDPGIFVRPVSDDLVAVLQIEMPNAFRSIDRNVAEPWGTSEDNIWAQALENIHLRVPVTDEAREVAPETIVRVLHGPHRLVVSHLLELERHLTTSATDGVIVGLPHENLLQFHAIADASAEAALGYVLHGTAEMFGGSPHTAISPHTYWWRDGVITRLTAWIDDSDSIVLQPPADFDELMRRLISQGTGAHGRDS